MGDLRLRNHNINIIKKHKAKNKKKQTMVVTLVVTVLWPEFLAKKYRRKHRARRALRVGMDCAPRACRECRRPGGEIGADGRHPFCRVCAVCRRAVDAGYNLCGADGRHPSCSS